MPAIVLTHGHNDHINAAAALQELVDAPILLHPADRMLWDVVYPDRAPDRELATGDTLRAGGTSLAVINTPGHSPGCCCFYDADADDGPTCSRATRCSAADPGATGRSFSDFDTIIRSIREQLLTLPPETVVHTGHGDTTTIGDEAPHLEDWLRRGH